MTELIINSRRYVISRQRETKVELVCEDGSILKLDETQLLGIPRREIHRGVVPHVIPFASRPRSFLTTLRLTRDMALADRQRAKVRGVRTQQPKRGPSIKRKSKKTLVSEANAMLPFDLSAIMKKGKA